MTEHEQQQLMNGLMKHRAAWQPPRRRAHERPPAKRMTRRDRELMECMRNR